MSLHESCLVAHRPPILVADIAPRWRLSVRWVRSGVAHVASHNRHDLTGETFRLSERGCLSTESLYGARKRSARLRTRAIPRFCLRSTNCISGAWWRERRLVGNAARRRANRRTVSRLQTLAEGEGFEPPEPLPVQWFSRPPPSTTRSSLRTHHFIRKSAPCRVHEAGRSILDGAVRRLKPQGRLDVDPDAWCSF
jgi:hypothetical protein